MAKSFTHLHKGAFVLPYLNKRPRLAASVFLAPGVCIFGDVELGEAVSFWCNSMARGDVNAIRVGRKTNIQDLCALHVTEDAPLFIGEENTVGHRAILHGCTIGNRCLIGMGSIVLDHAEIEDECVIAAGTLITEGSRIAAGSLVMGIPGKVKRQLTDHERQSLVIGSKHYIEFAQNYVKTEGFF